MNVGDIVITKGSSGKTSLSVIVEVKSNEQVFCCQMRRAQESDKLIQKRTKDLIKEQIELLNKNPKKKKKNRYKQNQAEKMSLIKSIYIDKIDKLQNDSIIIINKVKMLSSNSLIMTVGKLRENELGLLIGEYSRYKQQIELHKELHELKRKIAISQFNNQRYELYQKQLDKVIEELGFTPTYSKPKETNRVELITPKGKIKIYLGGRGGK